MTALAGRPRTRVLAWSLAALAPLVMAGGLVLLGFNARVMSPTRIGVYVFAAVAVVVYAGIGGLIAARIPRNPIGWLLCLTGLALAVSLFLEQYGLRGLATAPGSLPAVRQITALGYGTQQVAFVPLIIVLLLFPDGRLPSRLWRPVLWCAIAATTGAGFAQMLQRGTVVTGSLTNALSAAHVSYPNPLGIFPRHGWYSDLLAVAGAITLVSAVLAVVSVFVRRRGASPELRQQLAWLAYVGVLTFGCVVVLIGYNLATPGGDGLLGTVLFVLVFGTPIFGIPLACAVAVLRYHLYDLDVVVKRTVVAALVAATFTAVYVLVVVAVGAVTGRPGGNPLTFVAAALAAVLLQPVRTRAGQLADRLVYGRRATPYEVLSEFSEQIAGTYSTEDVLPRMARMLAEATGAQQAEVWLRAAGSEQLEAAWPSANGSAAPATAAAPGAEEPASPEESASHEWHTSQEEPASPEGPPGQTGPSGAEEAGARAAGAGNGRARSFVVEHHGERLGALRITSSPREPLTPAGERLVRDVAAQAGLVLRNVALIEDLRASRQRLVAAADEARRRLERNLHDGAQQQLVALRITLQLARQLVADAPGEAAELLAQTEQEAQDALEELRDLARGIYPPLLADLGLPAALEAQARKAPLPVTVQAEGIGRYPQDVEAAVYFCVLEALQNIAKYAQASAAVVSLGHDGGRLTFTVSDDGRGFDPAAAPTGTGVLGMADRLAALGGTLRVSSAPGHGTQVTGRVPAAVDTALSLSSPRRDVSGPLPVVRRVAEPEFRLPERDPVARAHQQSGADPPSVGPGAVGRAEVGQYPVVPHAAQLGVAPRHRHVGEPQIGAGGPADREHRPVPAAGQHQARQAHGPPRRPQLPGEPVPRRRRPVGQPDAGPGWPQVVEQAGELARIPRLQRELQPVDEGLMRQAAVRGPFLEHLDRFVTVRVGHPERRPLRIQGRHGQNDNPREQRPSRVLTAAGRPGSLGGSVPEVRSGC
jgi:signal transduction histidine kinase